LDRVKWNLKFNWKIIRKIRIKLKEKNLVYKESKSRLNWKVNI
jgi:hypothetical protein